MVDFANKIVASSSFLDEGILKLLADGLSPEDFERQVYLKNLHPKDRETLEILRVFRARS